jgi:hypothetical protein
MLRSLRTLIRRLSAAIYKDIRHANEILARILLVYACATSTYCYPLRYMEESDQLHPEASCICPTVCTS